MYTNFIYFIVVLLILSTQQSTPAPRLSALSTIGAGIGLIALFALINSWVFRRLAARIRGPEAGSRSSVIYYRTLGRQSLLAFIFFCLHVYLLDLKFYLTSLALFRNSFTLQGLAAIGLFLLHLAIVWLLSYECHRLITASRSSRGSLVVANLRFNMAILLPWIIISGAFDLFQLLPVGFLYRQLNTPLGQILFFALVLVIFMLFAPPLVLRLWGCRPLPSGSRRWLIEQFCRQHDFQVREIVLWPRSSRDLLTAGVMGLHRRSRYILVSEALLSILDDDELRAVLAHEMGHVTERHLFFYLLFLLGYLVLAYALSDLSSLCLFASALTVKVMQQVGPEGFNLVSLMSTLPLVILLVVYFRYLFGFFIRNFERQADLHGLTVMGNHLPLVSALEKVAFYSGNTRDVPSWHHFSIRQRVEYLAASAGRPALIQNHRRKLRIALAAYLMALTLIGTTGYLFQEGIVGRNLNEYLRVKGLTTMVMEEPRNSFLHLALGTLHYQRHNLKDAVGELEKALDLDPHNPEIMNNLAWILATSGEPPFFQPKRALALAEEAAHASTQAHILDTLAEAYHVNGRNGQALAAAEKALAAAPSADRSYYRKQVERFRSLAGESASRPQTK
jgi:Zn-dependent protease with chaperone function